MADYRFKLGMYLPELDLPFDQALTTAKDIGAEYVWFPRLRDETPIAEMTDAQVDDMAARVSNHGLKLHLIAAENSFKKVHLTELDLDGMQEHPEFRCDFDNLVRAMQIASRLGVGAVCSFTFAWPGEYGGGKPTWPMRWHTRGGIIADADMEKLVKAFSLVVEQAEKYDVDVALSMMPWNYTNTTGNFRRVAESVGSPRIKVMWGPADNLNCGEADVTSAGFDNVRPYLHGLHIKDLHLADGEHLQFEYRPIGDGDVDFRAVLRQLRDYRCDAVLAVATHFRPPGGSPVDAMRTNYARLKELIDEIEAEA